MPVEANGTVRPISQIAVPLAVVLSIGAAVLMSVLSVTAGGIWAGVSWWRSELEGVRREVHAQSTADADRLQSLRTEMLSHNETARIAMEALAALQRDFQALRERLSLSEGQLAERDRERVRRLDALERRSERRDEDWETISQRVARVEETLRALRQGHAQLSVQGGLPRCRGIEGCGEVVP